MSKLKNPSILVLSGGSIKGITFLGAIKYLEEKKIMQNIRIYSGSSVGAMILYLLNIGYNSDDLISILLNMDITNTKDITTESILGYFKNFGFDTGKNMIKILQIFTIKKKLKADITFNELFDHTGIKLYITGTNVSKKIPKYFSYESEPDMSIIEAIRISISIPLVFNAYKYKNDLYVDGSLMDNYPISLFKNKNEILGLYIENKDKQGIDSIDHFIYSLITCLIKRESLFYKKRFSDITVNIKVDVMFSNFDLTYSQKKTLYTIGYQNMHNYYEKYYYRFK